MASPKSEKKTKEDVVSELIIAVRSGQYNLVKSILEGHRHGFAIEDIVDTATPAFSGWTTALIEACSRTEGEDGPSLVKLLLDHGADPDISIKDTNLIPLHVAVKRDDLTSVRLLLEGNASVNQTNLKEKSALHLCCDTWGEQPKLEILTTLIKYKADVNLQDENGNTPMHFSCRNNKPELTVVLLENGALATIQDREGTSPLHVSVSKGDISSVRKILESGTASVDQASSRGVCALHLCCGDRHYSFEMVETLIKHKADVNLQNDSGYTPMHYSCLYNHSDATIAFLENGALPMIQDERGNSPLHLAAQYGALVSVRKMLETGKALVNQTNHDGQSALHLCCNGKRNGEHYLDILETLINSKADVNLQDNHGRTPMHMLSSSLSRCDLLMVEALHENGALVTIQDNSGQSPLHLAVARSNLKMVRLLCTESSVNQINIDGHSALHLCCKYSQSQTLDLAILTTLLNHKADVNLQDKNGKTPLHFSCAQKADDLTRSLLEEGALLTIQDNAGEYPLHLAIKHNALSILNSVDSHSLQPNENIELTIEACELAALSSSFTAPFESMHKATVLRLKHNIPKKTLEPMDCYGFHKEWETIEELKTYKGDGKMLKLQATLAGERIYQGNNTKMIELIIKDHLIHDVVEACKTDAGELIEHHLKIWMAQPRDRFYKPNLLKVMRAWKKMIEEHFESFGTRAVTKIIRLMIEHCVYDQSSDLFEILIVSATVLIMKLYRRNTRIEDASEYERTLAKELLQELLDTDHVQSDTYFKRPLQHLITEQNFSFPPTKHDVLSRTPYDWDLMKILLESRIQLNEVDSNGETILHYAVWSMGQEDASQFSQDVVDQCVKTITLILEKGVYPNARNKQFKTAREMLDSEFSRRHDDGMKQRMSDILQIYEHQHAMTLKHMAAVAVKESSLRYEAFLPAALVKFVNLQGYT